MTGISTDSDSAGGDLIPGGQSSVYLNGQLVIVHGDSVEPHAPLVPPHDAATMVASTSTIFINGKAVVQSGDSATCGHTATGSGDVFGDRA